MAKGPHLSMILLSVLVLSLVFSCFFIPPETGQVSAYAASDEKAYSVDRFLVSANTAFGFSVFSRLVADDRSQNVVISPLSISTALAMTFNGAEGTTKDAMAKVLKFGDMSLEEVNQEYLKLIGSLENADHSVSLVVGNSIWTKKEFEPFVKSTFTERIKSYYKGEIFTRDFTATQTVNEINGWVEKKTSGKIDEVIKKIDPELVMFLINAIYFKGEWVTKFDEENTQKRDFFLTEGDSVKVDMMSTSGNFGYYDGESFQVVRLPYGRDKIAMYVFLPDENVSLDSLISDLSQNSEEYIDRLDSVSGLTVKLPKFKVEYGVKRLNNVLEQLGMGIAFSPAAANFSGIGSTSGGTLYISYVDHKAMVEVNEEGTEAAAVTVVGIALTSLPQGITLTVDRPFFFEIRDDRSGSILFMGAIVNPT